MYIPKPFLSENENETIKFMQEYSFATIVTNIDSKPFATHLPFMVSKKGNEIVLCAHFAKANPQWEVIEKNKNLIIFSEPHAYISPKQFEKIQNVPTWNYIAVHAYGNAEIISETETCLRLMEDLINTYEKEYIEQWNSLDMNFKLRMLNGIVMFEIKIDEIQSKKKLSQNMSKKEQENIIEKLNSSTNQQERETAKYMEFNLKEK